MPESKRRKPKSSGPTRPSGRAVATIETKGPSPTWYVALMWGLMLIGLLAILARFVWNLPQAVFILGLVGIAAGFLMTTNYR
ncbi:MAG TPA: cell division protein CrgA [Acidimicrobiia bacterium]